MLVTATAAEAQSTPQIFTGIVTGHLGIAAQGDVRDWTVTPGGSMAVLDARGLGVEIDAGFSGDFDTSQFADSGLATLVLNFIVMYPHERLRPYFTIGAGLTRVRVTDLVGNRHTDTDTAWDVGAGAVVMLNEALGFRGDVRYFRNFGRQSAIPLGDNGALDFVRSSFGVSYSWGIR
jgi:opacity protein-like surface antigen